MFEVSGRQAHSLILDVPSEKCSKAISMNNSTGSRSLGGGLSNRHLADQVIGSALDRHKDPKSRLGKDGIAAGEENVIYWIIILYRCI